MLGEVNKFDNIAFRVSFCLILSSSLDFPLSCQGIKTKHSFIIFCFPLVGFISSYLAFGGGPETHTCYLSCDNIGPFVTVANNKTLALFVTPVVIKMFQYKFCKLRLWVLVIMSSEV